MIPPVSPFGLIQEQLWPDRWLILVVAMLLNCTTRKQVEKVLPEFRRRWPGPNELLAADPSEVEGLCRPLGFARRRTQNLWKMSEAFVRGEWSDPRELPGVGEYGARSYEMFCMGKLGDDAPKDHALTIYWTWYKRQL